MAMSSAGQTGTPRCSNCTAKPPRYARAVSYGSYDDLREAIHLMKFDGVPSLAKPLGLPMAQAIRQFRGYAPERLAVIPVPLHRGKRAFNQSTLLAQEALRHLRIREPEWKLDFEPRWLRRTRPTESQFSLTAAQRRANVRGAFTADPAVRGRDVLVIDDIYTTGATVNECTRVLLRAGAASVWVATLARAQREIAVRWQPMPHPARGDPFTAPAAASDLQKA